MISLKKISLGKMNKFKEENSSFISSVGNGAQKESSRCT